jgi:CubicO group peptidase (beta-lactamase class C family)
LVPDKRLKIVLGLAALVPGLLLLFVGGLWTFMTVTARPFHPAPDEVPSTAGASPAPEWAAAVERGRQVMIAGLTSQNLPGLSVAVGVDGDLVWAEGFGWADIDSRVPVEPDTRFQIGMASKALTSAAVGLLLEEGRLKLDDEIQTYVPEYPKQPRPVTLRQLMGHLAGVGTDEGDEGPLREHCGRTLEGLRLFADRPLLFEPGTGYRYSNYGWILVSAAVEAAADEPFLKFMRRRIFDPLGMDETMADSPADPAPGRAAFYFPRFAADPRYGEDGARHVDYSCFAGSGAFASTPSDLVRFGLAMNGGALLQPATVQLLQTSLRLPSDGDTGYGLGWDLETVDLPDGPARMAGHDGDVMGGRVVSFMTFPHRGLVVAVTSNIAWTDTFSLAADIARVFAERRPGQESSR